MAEKLPLESEIVKAIMKWLKDAGYTFVYKTHGSAYQVAGLPDIVVIDHKGRFVGLECKRPTGHLTALQAVTLNKILGAGGYAAVVTSVEDVRQALQESERGCSKEITFCEGTRNSWR